MKSMLRICIFLILPLTAACPTRILATHDGGADQAEGGGRGITGDGGKGGEAASASGGAGLGGGPGGSGGTNSTGGAAGGLAGTAGLGMGGVGGISTIGAGGSSAGASGSAGSGPNLGGIGGTGGGSGGATSAGGAAGSTPAPYVVRVLPVNGQTGVTADVQITITFSASMSQNAVDAAYTSSNLAPSTVTFSWDSSKTVLTITPKSPLTYATGTNPSINANTYSYVIGTGATDTSGRALSAPLSVSFQTLKSIITSISAGAVYRMATSNPDGTTPSAVLCTGGDDATPGHVANFVNDTNELTFVTFSLPQAPVGLYGVQSATLSASQNAPTGNPYSFSPLFVDQIPYESPPQFSDLTVAPIRSLGVFTDSGSDTAPSVSALASVQAAFTPAIGSLLFRLGFQGLPDAMNTASLICGNWRLAWTYLTP